MEVSASIAYAALKCPEPSRELTITGKTSHHGNKAHDAGRTTECVTALKPTPPVK